jgi:hypothetical protein
MSEQLLRTGNFEEMRGGHRHLPGNGTMPGPQPPRGQASLERAKAKQIVPLPRPKVLTPKHSRTRHVVARTKVSELADAILTNRG